MSSALSASPIGKIDYDVLREIFVHCLPEPALRRSEGHLDQPSIEDAPMLLSQVCSSWRTVTLESASLWSHLYYALTICTIQRGDRLESKLLAREVAFLQWWRKNQRGIPPFLRLSVKRGYRRTHSDELAQCGMDFILEYAASAQYLELSPFFWAHIYKWSKAGCLFTPSNLHTLVWHGVGSLDGIGSDYSFFQSQMLFQPHNLQRLALDKYRHGAERNTIPTFWSTLTHISVSGIATSLVHWFALLGGLPRLQWARFDIGEPREHTRFAPPTSITLPHLSTLFLKVRECDEDADHVPISTLFTNVHLPAVRTLALSWEIGVPELICSVAHEVSAILTSAPAVTTLVLAGKFLHMTEPALAAMDVATGAHLQPIWTHAAHLAELRLETCATAKYVNRNIWDMLFTKGRWFDLKNVACPVRVVTLADQNLEYVVGCLNSSVAAFMAKSHTIHRFSVQAPNITFRFSSQTGKEMIEKEMEGWGSSTP